MRLILLSFLLTAFRLFAADEAELQEVRLAKAQLALAKHEEKEALSLIAQNLDPKHFHRASFQFLLEYHLGKDNISKAVKVLYYMIGKLHDKRVLVLSYDANFFDQLKRYGTPSRDALEVYFTIAELYYQLYEQNTFGESFASRLLKLSEKYFQVCHYYRFELGVTKTYLGKIDNQRENYNDAIEHFVEAKEFFEQQEASQNSINDLDFLIGKTLVHGGLLDPGSIYLRSLYLNADTNPALKAIAQEYLDILSNNFFSLSARFQVGHKANVYEMNDRLLDNYRLLEKALGPKDGQFNTVNVNMLYNYANITEHLSALFIASFSQTSFSETLHQNRNSQIFSGGVELKSDNFEKGLGKLRYFYTQEFVPLSNDGEFESASTTHLIEPIYVRPIQGATLTYSLPILLTNYEGGGDEKSVGVSANYSPFSLNRFFIPYLGVGLSYRREVDLDDSSLRYEVNAGMQNEWDNSWMTFANLTYRKNSNATVAYDYNELEASVNATWAWRFGLSFTADALWYKRSLSNERTISYTTLMGGIAFTY